MPLSLYILAYKAALADFAAVLSLEDSGVGS
jgi:hypothetical protein